MNYLRLVLPSPGRARGVVLCFPFPRLRHKASRRLVAVGEFVGIRIADHVVIGGGRYVSFLERGLIPA